jgi:hypothetical protein
MAMERVYQPLSLFQTAAKAVAKNVDLAVQNDAQMLKKSGELTEDNVRKNIENEIALLELHDDLSTDVWQAYRRICKKRDQNQEQLTQKLELDRCIACYNISLNKKHIAVVTNCNANECMLRVWDDSILGFKETVCQLSDGPIVSIQWGYDSDTELVLLTARQVAIVEREKDQFFVKYVGDLCRSGDADQRILWDGMRKKLAVRSAQQDTNDTSHIVDCYTIRGNQLAYRYTIKPGVKIYAMHFKDDGRLGIERLATQNAHVLGQVLRTINDLIEEKIIAKTKDNEISVVTTLPSLDGIAAYLVKQAQNDNA